MPTSLPLPVRVLVKGSSNVNWVSWVGGPRTDFTFPRVVEQQLLSDGRPCDVQAITMTSDQAKTTLRTWQREILGFSPDVIVLLFGHFEAVHLFLPRWLERHAHSLKARPRRLTTIYRQTVVKPLWKLLARVQSRLDTLPQRSIVGRRRARRVAADLERYISHVQKIGSPLVILFEFPAPNEKFRNWFPGMTERIELMNRAIEDMVTRIDKPHVRYFPVSGLIDKHCGGDLELAVPDGFHYTPEMHRAVGEELAGVIEEWADTQPHLAVDGRQA